MAQIFFAIRNEWPVDFGHFWSLAIEEQFYLLFAAAILLVPVRHAMQRTQPVATFALIHLRTWYWAKSLGSRNFFRCDAPSPQSMANELRTEPSATGRRLVAPSNPWSVNFPILFGALVVKTRAAGGRAELRLRETTNGSARLLTVDHVIAGTDFIIDVQRLKFLHPELRCAIQPIEQAPKLNANFETSVSGLHFIGPASAMSFGPYFDS
jgi:hypothetical protein